AVGNAGFDHQRARAAVSCFAAQHPETHRGACRSRTRHAGQEGSHRALSPRAWPTGGSHAVAQLLREVLERAARRARPFFAARPRPPDHETRVQKPTLTAKRHYAAPVEKVYRAWIDPEALRRWFGPSDEGRIIVSETDPRVGGRFRIVLEMPSG